MIRATTREQVATALLSKLQTINLLKTIGRKHVMPSPDAQPALFSVLTTCTPTQKAPLPPKLRITFMLFVYVCDTSGDQPVGQEDALVETAINDILDAIEKALDPGAAFDKQTLGGIVEHCWIEGDQNVDPGVFGKQGFAILPVHVLVP